jgi:hypothetical protein
VRGSEDPLRWWGAVPCTGRGPRTGHPPPRCSGRDSPGLVTRLWSLASTGLAATPQRS